LPPFDTAGSGSQVAAAPPFSFPGVTMRVFPLAADIHALQRFCDGYLNLAPDFALFRPAMPYVMLMIVDYGRMSVESGNLGWTSQHEVVFSVPLEWYIPREGRFVLRGLAQVAPFIFVDSEASQVVGREVYGWPKVQGWFAGEVDRWATDPRARRELLRLDTRIFRRLYDGKRPVPRELLVIEQDPDPSFSLFPPHPEAAFAPLVGLPKALLGWSAFLARSAQAWTRVQLESDAALGPRTLPDLVAALLRSLDRFAGSFQANTINLKQFRDATHPALACYQAITNARMEITQIQRAGMLGDLALLAGDPSGGHRIRLHRYAAQPIVETLGLAAGASAEDERVAVLKPALPFWMKLDLRYLAGENLCWRTDRLSWRNQTHAWVPSGSRPDAEAVPEPGPPRYNTIGSAGFQVAAGPFRFPGATLRVLPLRADPARLAALCDASLNRDSETGRPSDVARFEPWGSYVYLVIRGFTAMSSENDDVGLWADKLAYFAVPVRWYERGEDGAERLASVGLYSPFMFSNGEIETTTLREVNGWQVDEAEIDGAASLWLDPAGPFAACTPLMQLQTEVFPVVGEGQRSRQALLLEVLEGDLSVWQARSEWSERAAEPESELERDLESMRRRASSPHFTNLRALCVELLANGAPLNHFALKQFRDSAEPLRACYQALVRSRTAIEAVHELRELGGSLHVAIHRYPTQPIVETLGLVVESRYATPQGVAECVKASRPFFVRADLRTEPGETLAWRAGSMRWRRPERPAATAYFLAPTPTAVGPRLVEAIDSRPQQVRDTLRVWSRRIRQRLDRETAARAVTSELEPQMLVHATLSREWEHAGESRWQQGREPLPLFVASREAADDAARAPGAGTLDPEP
jgi:hypothetical protein